MKVIKFLQTVWGKYVTKRNRRGVAVAVMSHEGYIRLRESVPAFRWRGADGQSGETMVQILIVDDDKELCHLLEDYFQPEGIVCRFSHDGRSALASMREKRPDMVILDVMLPEKNGFEVLRTMRKDSLLFSLPVIMLTARGDAGDMVRGLDMGADDYLPKPFNPRELLSRLRAVMRRVQPVLCAGCGDLRLDDGAMKAWKGEEAVALSGQEYRVLRALLNSPGQVVSRDELSRAVFGRDAVPMERGLDMQISRVRRKLGPYSDGSERIRSIRGAGYMYVVRQEELS